MYYEIRVGVYDNADIVNTEMEKYLFGQNTEERYNLYFHYYNVIHEIGHCILHDNKASLDGVAEEMWVNRFAVGYLNYVAKNNRLLELKEILDERIDFFGKVVPEGKSFIEYFASIWNTEELSSPNLYGFFQFSCVKKAILDNEPLNEVLDRINIKVNLEKLTFYEETIDALKNIKECYQNIKEIGLILSKIEGIYVMDPFKHQAESIY